MQFLSHATKWKANAEETSYLIYMSEPIYKLPSKAQSKQISLTDIFLQVTN